MPAVFVQVFKPKQILLCYNFKGLYTEYFFVVTTRQQYTLLRYTYSVV